MKFRDWIMDDGFLMMQYSVYVRNCPNDSAAEKHISRVRSFKPKYGNVRILKVTEHQYQNIIMVAGEKTEQETLDSEDTLIVI